MSPSNARVDFNCDLGEGCGNDEVLLPLISSASIACGGHAGDPASMRSAVRGCLAHHVAIGAHPSLPDRRNFGRATPDHIPDDLAGILARQIAALAAVAAREGTRLAHVKPHGALYHLAAEDVGIAETIVGALRSIDDGLRLYARAGSPLVRIARGAGVPVVEEAFAERRYEADGRLTPRSDAAAELPDQDAAVAQTLDLLRNGEVTARDGTRIRVRADTICLHGDRRDAVAFARALRDAIQVAGFAIRAPD